MSILTKLDRRFGKYAISRLMIYLIIGYSIMWLIMNFQPSLYYSFLAPDMSAVFHGEVWRLLTIILLPPEGGENILLVAINLYFLYFIGQVMEKAWGSFALNLFFFAGYLLHIIMAVVMYAALGINLAAYGAIYGSYFLTMALFVLVGITAPDIRVLFMFFIPVKMKWLAFITMVILGMNVICGFGVTLGTYFGVLNLTESLFEVIAGLANFGIYPFIVSGMSALICIIMIFTFYFMMKGTHVSHAQKARTKEYKKKVNVASAIRTHKCAICGRTSEDDARLEFRYCSKCNGSHEYCQDHLFTHEHIK